MFVCLFKKELIAGGDWNKLVKFYNRLTDQKRLLNAQELQQLGHIFLKYDESSVGVRQFADAIFATGIYTIISS